MFVMLKEPSTREEIILNLYHSPDFAQALGKMHPEGLREDLKQEMFVVLCKMDEERLVTMHRRGQLRWYLAGMMMRMLTNAKSDFFRLYRSTRVEGEDYTHFTDHVQIDIYDGLGDDAPPTPKALMHIDGEEKIPPPADHVEEAMNSIDEYEANMLRVYEQLDRTSRIVAAETGISDRTVRYVVNVARTKLKKKIRSYAD